VHGLPDDAQGLASKAAVQQIRAWVDAGAPLLGVPDRGGVIPHPGAAIYREFRTRAQEAAFQNVFGASFRPMFYPEVHDGDMEDDHGSFYTPDALFLRALLFDGPVAGAAVPARLVPVSRSYFGGPNARAAVLVAVLQEALAALTTRFGTGDQARWTLPALLETYRDIGLIGSLFGATVMERENRGSFNVVAELSQPVRSEIIVSPGASGTFTAVDVGAEPAHLRDQLPLYEAFAYRRQPFAEYELEAPVTSETVPLAP
jgi:penicillin amidase